jgi:hypothetical protein
MAINDPRLALPLVGDSVAGIIPQIPGPNLILQSDPTGSFAQWVPQGVAVGPQGPQGVQGNAGLSGLRGFQGSQGTQGTQGAQGFQGVQGATGSQGTQGSQGAQGNQGVQGATGSQGAQGVQGATGSQGSQGVQGTQGVQGAQGTQGAQGFQGFQGNQGTQGVQGFQGAQGNQGFQGAQGNQGAAGNSAMLAWRSDDGGNTTSATFLGAWAISATASTDEFTSQIVITSPGVLRNLLGSLETAATPTFTYTVRKNGVDTALTCTVPTLSTSASDTTHTVTVAAGDRISLKCVTSVASSSNIFPACFLEYAA